MSDDEPDHDHSVYARDKEEHQDENTLWVRTQTLATRSFDDGRSLAVAVSGTRVIVDFYDEDGNMANSAFYRMEELVGEAAMLLGYDDYVDAEEE